MTRPRVDAADEQRGIENEAWNLLVCDSRFCDKGIDLADDVVMPDRAPAHAA